jgi:amidophosphoribosyltransferase
MLREAGATEVHLRISLPPVAWPCFFGMDFGTRTELIAASMSVGEIREYLGSDSLAYLELDRLVAATGTARSGFCTACLTGEYPIEVPIAVERRDVEAPLEQPAHDAATRG